MLNSARWRRGNAGVCKTPIHRFDSGTRLIKQSAGQNRYTRVQLPSEPQEEKNMSAQQERTIGEKVLWWTQVGGVVAGLLGIIRHCADLAVGGFATTAAAIGIEGVLYRKNQIPQAM